MAVVNAVLAALFHRERHGQGQQVEVPMLETMTAIVLAEHLGGLTFDPQQEPAGYARLLSGGRKPAPTKDGFIAMLPYTGEHWEALLQDHRARGSDHAMNFMTGIAATSMCVRCTGTWPNRPRQDDCRVDGRLRPARRAGHPIYSLEELPNHPHLKAVEFLRTAHMPGQGTIRYVRPPVRFMGSPAQVRSFAPLLGEHSAQVLGEAGFSGAEIDALTAEGVIKQTPSAV
jgi:formyl-CoA transferase